MKKMTKSQYARHRGCKPSYISQLLREKVIVEDENGRLDPDECDRKIAVARVRADSPLPPLSKNDAASERIQAARAQSEESKAAILALEHGRMAGSLVTVDSVCEAAFKSARNARNQLLAIPDRLSPLLAAERDVGKIHSLLSAEIRRVVTDLANQPIMDGNKDD